MTSRELKGTQFEMSYEDKIRYQHPDQHVTYPCTLLPPLVEKFVFCLTGPHP
jgi:hypothetical protein